MKGTRRYLKYYLVFSPSVSVCVYVKNNVRDCINIPLCMEGGGDGEMNISLVNMCACVCVYVCVLVRISVYVPQCLDIKSLCLQSYQFSSAESPRKKKQRNPLCVCLCV